MTILAACVMGLLGAGEGAPRDLEVRVIADIAYLAAGRNERLDFYLPVLDREARPVPAVVMIHGGGWTGGDKAQAREQSIGRTLARAGYVMASINYRLGAKSFPENVLDAKNAVRFLRARAAEYRVDPERIAVMGGSAGGRLALMVACTEGMKDLEYARNGNRSRFQAAMFSRRDRLHALALAECVEDKGRLLDAIADTAWAISEESSWTVPAHQGAQKAGTGLADTAEPIVDLFSAQAAHSLAWTLYLLGDRLDKVSPLLRPRLGRPWTSRSI